MVREVINTAPFMDAMREAEHRAAVLAHGRRCDGAIVVIGAVVFVALATLALAGVPA